MDNNTKLALQKETIRQLTEGFDAEKLDNAVKVATGSRTVQPTTCLLAELQDLLAAPDKP